MKLKLSRFYVCLFGVLVLLQIYLPSFRTNVMLQIGALCLVFMLERKSFRPAFLKIAIPVIAIFVIAFVGTFWHRYNLVNVIKDISHFIKPITGLCLGYLVFRRVGDFKVFVRSIVVLGFISALIHFFILGVFSKTTNLEEIREFGRDNFLELFALFLAGFYKRFTGEPLFARLKFKVFFTVILLSSLLYFSRTMLIASVFICLAVFGYARITAASLKWIGVGVLGIVGIYVYLFSIKIDRDGPGIQNFLYKVKNAPTEIFETHIDREDHADLWDHWRGYEAKRALSLMADDPFTFLTGAGHGSLVNLKFYAPLSGEPKGMKFISELHNGYIYLLYKTGIFGIVIYLIFLFRLYGRVYGVPTLPGLLIGAIGLYYIFTTLTITGIYNAKDIVIFVLGALLFYEGKLNLVPMPEPNNQQPGRIRTK